MATWQFDLLLLPKAWLVKNPDWRATRDESGLVNLEKHWSGFQPTADLDELLSRILPIGSSRSSSLTPWGIEDGNRIEVWRDEEGDISSIFVRIDLRGPAREFVDHLVNLAVRLDCWFLFAETLELAAPSRQRLTDAILASSAFRFVENPRVFLDELSRKRKEP